MELLPWVCLVIGLVAGREFYVGMWKKRDFLAARDTIYKDRVPFGIAVAKYGRIFQCPITYFKVVDRLGVGRGPKVQIIRGGLQKKFLTLKITSSYNFPLNVNIYVGCQAPTTTTKAPQATTGINLAQSTRNTIDTNNTPSDNSSNGAVAGAVTATANTTAANTTMAQDAPTPPAS